MGAVLLLGVGVGGGVDFKKKERKESEIFDILKIFRGLQISVNLFSEIFHMHTHTHVLRERDRETERDRERQRESSYATTNANTPANLLSYSHRHTYTHSHKSICKKSTILSSYLYTHITLNTHTYAQMLTYLQKRQYTHIVSLLYTLPQMQKTRAIGEHYAHLVNRPVLRARQ